MTGAKMLKLGVSKPKNVSLSDLLESHLEIVKLVAVSGDLAVCAQRLQFVIHHEERNLSHQRLRLALRS
jgi:hypothetical protein